MNKKLLEKIIEENKKHIERLQKKINNIRRNNDFLYLLTGLSYQTK